MTLKILDLFSGIGTFSYAFDQVEREGNKIFETVAFCEIDKDAHRVLRKHWPNVPIFEDVSNLKYENGVLWDFDFDKPGVETKIDIIVGGFPCTDISVAGNQKGLYDEELYDKLISEGKTEEEAREESKTRSGLWSQYKRLISEIKPKYVIIENVRALLSNGIATVLQDLSEVGYDAEWEVISARDVGQCHLRERIWIVAYPNSSSVRNGSEWPEIRRNYLQASGETELRDSCEAGGTSVTDSLSQRRIQHEGQPQEVQPGRQPELQRSEGEQSSLSEPSHDCESLLSRDNDEGSSEWKDCSDLYYFRYWPSFTSEEEKSQWWAEATAEFRDWRKTQPEVCGIHDGPTTGLHEKFRRARIKQLGNGIVFSIAKLHAERIKYHEFNPEAHL